MREGLDIFLEPRGGEGIERVKDSEPQLVLEFNTEGMIVSDLNTPYGAEYNVYLQL